MSVLTDSPDGLAGVNGHGIRCDGDRRTFILSCRLTRRANDHLALECGYGNVSYSSHASYARVYSRAWYAMPVARASLNMLWQEPRIEQKDPERQFLRKTQFEGGNPPQTD